MGKLSIELGGREVYWELGDEELALIAQTALVAFGPAVGER